MSVTEALRVSAVFMNLVPSSPPNNLCDCELLMKHIMELACRDDLPQIYNLASAGFFKHNSFLI